MSEEINNEANTGQEQKVQYPYVVRGAGIYCTYGSHIRKLDMPASHGSYVRGKAMMNEKDCKVGIEQNIPPFGACFSGENDGMDIVIHDAKDLVPYMDENGNPVEPQLPIEGKLCTPRLVDKWQGAQEDTLVDGKPALNVNCSITCSYGGTIAFVDSGQGVY